VDRHEKVRHVLHLAAVAELAEIVVRPGKTLEHRLRLVESRLVAAAVNAEIPGFRLRTGARKRAVQQRYPLALQSLERRGFFFDRQRAGFDDDAFAFQLGGDGVQRLRAGERGDDDPGLAPDLGGRARGMATRLGQPIALGRQHVVAVHGEAGARQVGRDGPAHRPQPDDPDALQASCL
jgi:hypothetical protein